MNAQAQTMFDTIQQPRRMICGVCANLAVRSGFPVWTIRVAAAVLLLMHWLVAVIVYFGAAAWLRSPNPGTWRDLRGTGAAAARPNWDRDGLSDRFYRLDRRLSRMEQEAMDSEANLRRQFRDLDR
jgi:phage shock protein PspC (stress-responsive transcriptional regulator)